MSDWIELRRHFPVLERCVYADNAAVGAVPTVAVTAASAALTQISEQGMAAYGAVKQGGEEARARVARFLHAHPDEIGFTDCTSTSMSLLALMARQQWESAASDRREVVLLRGEFPSSTLAWLNQGFEPVWIEPEPDNGYPVEKILDAVTQRTRAVVTSQVVYRTGVRVEVEALSAEVKRRGAWHVVNATQSACVVPQNLGALGASAVTITGVKWLCAGLGLGILYLSEELRRECRFPVVGWISQSNPFDMINDKVQTSPKASAVETGAVDVSRMHALGACVDLFDSYGDQAIHQRVLALNGRLIEGLKERGVQPLTPPEDSRRAGIVAVTREGAADFRDWAMENGVFVSLRRGDCIRFSLHCFNNEDDVQRLLRAWDECPV